MKRILLFTITLLVASLCFVGCEKMPLQRSFDYDGEALDPHFDMAAMTWLESRGDEFALMIEAIRHSEMEEYYLQNEQQYTFLVIPNNELKFWASSAGFTSISAMPKERVANLIKYHIIKGRYSTYYKEAPVDPVFVKTLIEGEDGLMTLKCAKSSYPIYNNSVTSGNVMINTQRTNGISPQRNSLSTNYITTNGVLHVIADYAFYRRDTNYKPLF